MPNHLTRPCCRERQGENGGRTYEMSRYGTRGSEILDSLVHHLRTPMNHYQTSLLLNLSEMPIVHRSARFLHPPTHASEDTKSEGPCRIDDLHLSDSILPGATRRCRGCRSTVRSRRQAHRSLSRIQLHLPHGPLDNFGNINQASQLPGGMTNHMS